MKRKMIFRVLSLVLILAVSVGLFPDEKIARAEQVYTVILSPGEGTGEEIVYRSNEGEIAPSWSQSKVYQFYYEDDHTLGFRVPQNSCPDSFTPPKGCVFAEWDSNSSSVAVSEAQTIITTRWKADPVIDGISDLENTDEKESYKFGYDTWDVIAKNDEKCLLVAGKQVFAEGVWSQIANKLEVIYNDFSEEEKKAVCEVSKSEAVMKDHHTLALVRAHLFLLSKEEVEYYFSLDDGDLPCGWSRTEKDESFAYTVEKDHFTPPYRSLNAKTEIKHIHPAFVADRSVLESLSSDTLEMPSIYSEMPKVKLKATSKNKTVTLKWNKITGADKYKVYKKAGSKFKTIKTLKKTRYTVKKGLKVGKKYTFAVRARVDGLWTDITKSSTKMVKIKK